ncbi:MAG: alpha/beta fold hydrolase [Gammaproteobacteria bacterium]
MFEHFETRRIRTGEAELHVRLGGAGPPLLLLHGYPQTHACWHAVAPALARHYSLVMPDLRGYGDSHGPPPDPAHERYSKRTMAMDMIELMLELGHERFALAGHDRGGRVGYRLALDHPQCIERFAAIDIVPTLSVFESTDMSIAMSSYHWFFLSQPAPMPETLIGADPAYYLEHLLSRWAGSRDRLAGTAVAEYARCFARPSVIAATCEDYRAGATLDIEHDRADREAGRRIECPTLVLWGRGYLKSKTGSPLEVWREWATDVREVALDCGHFVLEEEPEAAAAALIEFFAV